VNICVLRGSHCFITVCSFLNRVIASQSSTVDESTEAGTSTSRDQPVNVLLSVLHDLVWLSLIIIIIIIVMMWQFIRHH